MICPEREARGWFDPAAARRRRPLIVAGVLALIGASIGGGLATIGSEPVGVVGPMLLALAGIGALVVGCTLPMTTPEGAQAAAPWQGYRAGLAQARRAPEPLFDLDAALPYAVAMNATGLLDQHLKAASKRGYAPAWFARAATTSADGFYPYWAGVHASMGAGSSDGGSASSGASAGGGSAGGSF
jgi:hypothetical protein